MIVFVFVFAFAFVFALVFAFVFRVGKCHGYDGYIRVKKLASLGKKFGRPK